MFSNALDDNIMLIDSLTDRENTFDIKLARLDISGRNAAYYFIDGYVNGDCLQRVHIELLNQKIDTLTIETLSEKAVAFSEQKRLTDENEAVLEILGGNVVLFVDGISEALALNLYSFPKRSIEESEKNRTLRGPHDSFSESLLVNTVLIRRRIATPNLAFEKFSIGSDTNTRIALCYMKDSVNIKSLKIIKSKLSKINIRSATLAQEAVVNALISQSGLIKFNPLPRVRYIERPDTAASVLIEGKILIICDNSPSVIALPISIYDFFEEQNDYYFPPLTGSYLRIVRFIIFLLSIYLIPIWMLFISRTDLGGSLVFLGVSEDYSVPIFLQFLILEVAIDGLKFASINTPSSMSNSLGIVGGLLLGDYAVKSGWFIPQTILYSAFTSIANFVPLNYELGYSFKFARIMLIILTNFFGLYGIIGGTLFILLVLAFTKNIDGSPYLYPIVPFDAKALKRIFVLSSFGKEQNRKQ